MNRIITKLGRNEKQEAKDGGRKTKKLKQENTI